MLHVTSEAGPTPPSLADRIAYRRGRRTVNVAPYANVALEATVGQTIRARGKGAKRLWAAAREPLEAQTAGLTGRGMHGRSGRRACEECGERDGQRESEQGREAWAEREAAAGGARAGGGGDERGGLWARHDGRREGGAMRRGGELGWTGAARKRKDGGGWGRMGEVGRGGVVKRRKGAVEMADRKEGGSWGAAATIEGWDAAYSCARVRVRASPVSTHAWAGVCVVCVCRTRTKRAETGARRVQHCVGVVVQEDDTELVLWRRVEC